MDDGELEELLARWNRGDRDAAIEAVRACEPFLRMVIRRRLSERTRAKFDSEDITQSIWADILRGMEQNDHRFPDAAHLRAYLVKLARHRLIDRLRQHRAALKVERPLPEGDLPTADEQPRPSELAQADDLWVRILSLCPPNHRELIELKRQGRSLAEIAARTGLHEGSVRRILSEVAWRLGLAGTRGGGS